MRQGVVVLCGGRSSRMGHDKASLPFGPETMLQKVVRTASEVAPESRIVVVAGAEQMLPQLPLDVRVARDRTPGQGPLEGIAAGLKVLHADTDVAYITSCDVPLLSAEFMNAVFQALGHHDVCVPVDGEFFHPLAAVYRTDVLAAAERLLSLDVRSPRMLYREVVTRKLPVDDLRSVDPSLHSLMNLNSPEDYQAALRIAGL